MKNLASLLKSEPAAAAVSLRLVVAGHVDHGKSTLVGRLLHETGSLPEGKREAVEASCKKRGQPFEWAFVTDALQTERDQNVTIEASHIILKGKPRNIVLIDAPGHREFLRNMVTGAASADAALLIIDATEGISEQTRMHAALLAFMGMRQVVVAVSKMDAANYSQQVFDTITKDIASLGIEPLEVVPISARAGDNITARSKAMPWYKGQTLLALLETLSVAPSAAGQPLCLPIQDVYKQAGKRILVGRIESGTLKAGDTLLFSPANSQAKVASIEIWNAPATSASAGESIGITLDTPLFIERGQVASHESSPPRITNLFPARVFWLGKTPLENGSTVTLKIGTQETAAEIRSHKPIIYGDIADVNIRTRGQIALDAHALSRFVLTQDGEICGGGAIEFERVHDQRVSGAVKSQNLVTEEFGITADMRAKRNGHKGGVLWFTGLSGSGKSTIARLAQKKLFDKGCQVFVLDGDNIRQGLSRDLGFSPAERHENLRRVAEAASLFAQAGTIVITAFISPYENDREAARAVLPEAFHLIHIKASVTACEARDPKGLYKKARAGKIADFTGVTAPYENPGLPDLVLDTEQANVETSADALVAYVERHFINPVDA